MTLSDAYFSREELSLQSSTSYSMKYNYKCAKHKNLPLHLNGTIVCGLIAGALSRSLIVDGGDGDDGH